MSNIFRERYEKHVAETNKPRPPSCSAEEAATATRIYLRYRDGNCIDRAHLREHYGDLVELGRRVVDFENPEPPKAA